jgi:hypothetical protein
MTDTAAIIPTRILSYVKRLEVGEDGAKITLADDKVLFFNRDQVAQVWGTLTFALDMATNGQLASKIRRLGLWPVISASMQDAKTILEDERQFSLLEKIENKNG